MNPSSIGPNARFGISIHTVRFVLWCLRVLAQSEAATPEQLEEWYAAHTLAAYLPLRTLQSKLAEFISHCEPDSYDLRLWDCLTDSCQYTGIMDDFSTPGLSVCPLCRVQIESERHFESEKHCNKSVLQLFRFSPVGVQIENHQKWLSQHRLGGYDNLRRCHGAVRLTFREVNNGTGTPYSTSKWRNTSHDVTVISGSSNIGSKTTLVFEADTRSPCGPQVFVPVMTDNGYQAKWRLGANRLQSGIPAKLYVDIPDDNSIGLKYYELQFWVKYPCHERGIAKFLPFAAIVQWEHIHEEVKDAVDIALSNTNVKVRRQNPLGIARIPFSDFRPQRREGSQGDISRVVKPVRLDAAFLNPYFEVWRKIPGTIYTTGTRKSCRSNDLTFQLLPENVETSQVRALLMLDQPITIHNFAPRMLAEIVAQLEYEEEDPQKAMLSKLRVTTSHDLQSLDTTTESIEPDGFGADLASLYLTATVATNDLKALKLTSPLVRLMHPRWTFKYLLYIIGNKAVSSEDTMIVLKLNSGTKSMFLKPDGTTVQDHEGLFLSPSPGIAWEFLMALLKVVIYDDSTSTPFSGATGSMDEQANSPIRLVPPTESGTNPEVIMLTDSDGDADTDDTDNTSEGSLIVETSPKYDDNNEHSQHVAAVESQLARRSRFKECYRQAFRKTFESLFCEESPDTEPPQWVIPAELDNRLEWFNIAQQEIKNAILKGQRYILTKAPPGTGKTTCIAHLVTALALANPDRRFLCVASTNAASNILAEKIIDAYILMSGRPPQTTELLRYLKRGFDMATLSSKLIPNSFARTTPEDEDDKDVEEANQRQIRLCSSAITVCTIDMATLDFANSLESFHPFGDARAGQPVIDLMIIDEAAAVSLPRMAVVLPLAANGQSILLGDVLQLPAYIRCPKLKRYAGEESGLEFLLNLAEGNEKCTVVHLQHNYRSRSPILHALNTVVYHETPLIAAAPDALYERGKEDLLFPSGACVMFQHVEAEHQNHGVSLYNEHEMAIVAEMVENLVDIVGVSSHDIGIEATYAAQADILNEMLGPHYYGLKIACANGWQGAERDYMIISLVRSHPNMDAMGQPHAMGFLEGLRRLTVSVSRARKANVFVGNMLHFLDQPLIAEILRQVCAEQTFLGNVSAAVRHFVHLRMCEVREDKEDDPRVVETPSKHCVDFVERR